MKVLRDEVRLRILDAARDVFFRHGYAGASMRAIAARAGMTVGNIYLYFAGKAQLFDAVVGETAARIRNIAASISGKGDETLHRLVGGLLDVFLGDRTAFLILITRSEGSAHAAFKESIVEVACARMAVEMPQEEDTGFFAPFAVAVIEGLLYIFLHYDGDTERLSGTMLRFLHYTLRGLAMPDCPPMEDKQ